MNEYITDIKRQTVTANGQRFLPDNFGSLSEELKEFLREWFDGRDTVTVHTSGSTGTPKEMHVEKSRMMNSAVMTLSFLGLKPGDSALLCMPLRYIAGKMVVVRSLVGGLNLIPITPGGHPMAAVAEAPTFAAMIPMQAYNSASVPEELEKLKEVKHLILGGGAIDERLAEILKDFPNEVWSTYGMTETLSHIALRKLNGKDASDWYTPFPHVGLTLSEEGTLVVDAPSVCPQPLVTNDIATFDNKGRFRILGRKDNIINTGGIKVQAEEVETALRPLLPVPFIVTCAPDEKFGERIILLIETSAKSDACTNALIEQACENLPVYWRPKQIVRTTSLPLTETGKPDRARAKQIVAG